MELGYICANKPRIPSQVLKLKWHGAPELPNTNDLVQTDIGCAACIVQAMKQGQDVLGRILVDRSQFYTRGFLTVPVVLVFQGSTTLCVL